MAAFALRQLPAAESGAVPDLAKISPAYARLKQDREEAFAEIAAVQEKGASGLTERLMELTKRIEFIDAQLTEERMKASAAVQSEIAPRHAELAAGICHQLLQLRLALLAYLEYGEVLNKADIAWSGFRPVYFAVLGDPRERNSGFGTFLREAAARDIIKFSPEVLR